MEFNHSTSATGYTDNANSVLNDVLTAHSWRQGTIDLKPYVLASFCNKGLGGQDIFNFAGPDAKRQRAESAIGGY